MKLTHSQLLWLRQRGGRTTLDVLEDETGLYVIMYNGYGGVTKVYLPTEYEEKLIK